MPERTVISNTSPLLYLHQVGQLHLLHRLYGRVLVPAAVEAELQVGRERGVEVPDLQVLPWMNIVPMEKVPFRLLGLGRGEAEVLALGLVQPAPLLLLDEDRARSVARREGLALTGTLGVLLRAKESGHLALVAPVLASLRSTSMWLGAEVLDLVLAQAGEKLEP